MTLLATGALPLLHLGTHRDDHVHTPGGTIELVRVEDHPESTPLRLVPHPPDRRLGHPDAATLPSVQAEPAPPPAPHRHGSHRHVHVHTRTASSQPHHAHVDPAPAPAPPSEASRHDHTHAHDGTPAPHRHGGPPGPSRSTPHHHHGPVPEHGDGSLAHFAAYLDPVLPEIALPDRAAPAVEPPRFLRVALGGSAAASRARSRGPPEADAT